MASEVDPSPPEPTKVSVRKLRNRARNGGWRATIRLPATCQTTDEMTSLGVPDFLQHSYLSGLPPPSFTSLREWQKDLIKKDAWRSGRSVIVVVPTSGGKTVASDIAIAQLLNADPSAKAIYAVPFVALASEKYDEMSDRFFKFQVRPFYQNVGGSDFRRGHIAVCTYEKAHSLINAAVQGKYSHLIKLIVIDEVHILGDEGRGAVIEALIAKALLMNPSPRIIGLTATVNQKDALALAEWIRADCYMSETRPSNVRQFIAMNGELFIIQNGELRNRIAKLKAPEGDVNHIVDPIRRLLAMSPTAIALIFVNTRAETLKTAQFIASKLNDPKLDLPPIQRPSQEVVSARVKMIQDIVKVASGIDESIKKCLLNGIGIHHAGLLLEERKIIEEAAKNKILSVLVATTTLSAGVNIHSVERVFILDIYRWTPTGKLRISAAQYTQMVGRAGRTAGKSGEAFVFAHSDETEIGEILKLSQHQIPAIVPHLREPGLAERFLLQCLAIGLVSRVGEFLEKTFMYHPDEETATAQRLSELKLINPITERVTPLGRAIAGSSIGIEEGLILEQDIKDIQHVVCLNDEVHLLYLCVPPQTITAVKREPYNSPLWLYIFKHHSHVIKLVTKLDDRQIDRMQDLPMKYGGLGRVDARVDACCDRIFIAVMMSELINERPIPEITRNFRIDRGTLQSIQMQCASYAAQVTKFSELIGSALLAATLNKFKQRLNLAARTELLGLLMLPSMSKEAARKLFDQGILSPIELADLTPEMIEQILQKDSDADIDLETAKSIWKDASEYSESLTRIEALEESAMQNLS
jgi:replicative superfamily II helicase